MPANTRFLEAAAAASVAADDAAIKGKQNVLEIHSPRSLFFSIQTTN